MNRKRSCWADTLMLKENACGPRESAGQSYVSTGGSTNSHENRWWKVSSVSEFFGLSKALREVGPDPVEVAPPNSIGFVFDRSLPSVEFPKHQPSPNVLATGNCISVGTLAEIDGTTAIEIGSGGKQISVLLTLHQFPDQSLMADLRRTATWP